MKLEMSSNILAAALAVLVLGLACSREITEPVSAPISGDIPPTPLHLSAIVGDATVTLSWDISDTAEISKYYIYSADSSAGIYTKIGQTVAMSYTVSNLENGIVGYFSVSSVSLDGFEGYRCDPVEAVPDLYGIIISEGLEFIDTRDVVLILTAPSQTGLMQVSSDSSFSGSQWEVFNTGRNFRLPTGDGVKTVFARFRDSSGRMTIGHYSDTIILDTQAIIDSVRFSPSGAPFTPGDNVHFRLFAAETDGQAGVRIGNGILTFLLNDNGERGDVTADDGIYEVDYILDSSLDFENQIVFGTFTDRAGNDAGPVQAGSGISVRRFPDPVTLYDVNTPQGQYDRLELSWGRSSAQDFAQYRIYRGVSAGVDSSDYLVRVLSSSSATTLTDTGLSESTAYFYKVYVADNTGLWTGSNEADGTTGLDLPPDPANLYPLVIEPDRYSDIALEWSRCLDTDFESYRLFRWQEDIGRADSVMVNFTTDSGRLTFTDNPPFNTSEDTLNIWYILRTYDRGGQSSASDSIRAHLIDNLPPQVDGVVAPSDSALVITWTSPDLPDFGSYRLLRDIDSDPAGALTVFVTTLQATGSYTDSSAVETQVYFYWLDLADRRGNSSRTLLGSGSW